MAYILLYFDTDCTCTTRAITCVSTSTPNNTDFFSLIPTFNWSFKNTFQVKSYLHFLDMKQKSKQCFIAKIATLFEDFEKNPEKSEIPLFDSSAVLRVYRVEEKIYLCLRSVVDILDYFIEKELSYDLVEFIKQYVKTNVLSDLDPNTKDYITEVCNIKYVNEELYDIVSTHIEPSKYTPDDDTLFSEIKIDELGKSASRFESLNTSLASMYPFEDHWDSNAMDSILGDMYTELPEGSAFAENIERKECTRYKNKLKNNNLKERPFICEYGDCKRAFKRFEHLKRHNKMHTGERPFKCKYPGCMKAFSRSDNLAQHFKIHNVSQGVPYQNYKAFNFNSKQYH